MGGWAAAAQDAGHAELHDPPTTSAADELAHLSSLRFDRAIALAMGDDELAGDLEIDIAASADAFVGLAVTEIATLRGEVGGRDQG